jgi:hypothetical protein
MHKLGTEQGRMISSGMSVTFGGNIPSGFALAIRQHVYSIQVHALPQVEWTWRFFAIAGGKSIRAEIRIPARSADQTGGWDESRDFDSEIPGDVDSARAALSKWFDGVHAQFRAATGLKSVDDMNVLG